MSETRELRCWGCNRVKYLNFSCATKKKIKEFYLQWGPLYQSIQIVESGDGSYTTETFCPDCQKILSQIPKRTLGYLRERLAREFKKGERNVKSPFAS